MSLIAQQALFPYVARMSLRPLTTMLIAIAMLFAPVALQSGAAMAMAPANHHSQMMKSAGGHCDGQPAKSHDGKIMDTNCCAAMCAAATAILPSIRNQPHVLAAAVNQPEQDLFRHGFLAELPTPPPRGA